MCAVLENGASESRSVAKIALDGDKGFQKLHSGGCFIGIRELSILTVFRACCKNAVFAVGVSSTTETPISVPSCEFHFSAKSCIDFANSAPCAEFTFSLGGCCKPENFDPCAGQEGILFCLWPSAGLYILRCATPHARKREFRSRPARSKTMFFL